LVNARLITANKTTTGGATLILTEAMSLNRDCSPQGHIDAKIVAQPDHGAVSIQPGSAFPAYSPADPPYLCNARKSPATIVTYRATPGFTGQDTASIQLFFPDGRAPTILYHIDVR